MQLPDLCVTTDELVTAVDTPLGQNGLLLVAPQLLKELEPFGLHTLSPEAPDVWEHTKIRRATLRLATLNGRRAVEVLIDEQTCAQLRTVDDVLDAATALIEPRLDNLFNDLNP